MDHLPNPLTGFTDHKGRFIAGNPGNGGRKKGSKVKLSEAFLSDLYDQWERTGKEALQRIAENDPALLCKLVASLVPAQLQVTVSDEWESLPLDDLRALVVSEVARLGLAAQVIEQTTESDTPQESP